MVTVKDLLETKGRLVHSIPAGATVYEALKLMAGKGVGALVVLDDEKLVGIISERDYARKIILEGKFSKDTLVREIMSTALICIGLNDAIEGCMALMTDKRIRHMPVLEEGKLVGIISIGDVVNSIISSQEVAQAVINSLLRHSLEDMSLDELLKRSLELIFSIPWLAFEKQGSIFLVENNSNALVMKAEVGLAGSIKKACARIDFGKCLCGQAAATRKIQFADCLDERHEIQYDGIIPHGHYCVPICYSNETLGVINIYVREGHRFAKRERDFLFAVANTLAGIIMRKRLEKELVISERLSAIGQTVAGLAHSIRSILFGLEGGIYVVNKALRKDDMQKMNTGWNMVKKNIEMVSNLVSDLLGFSKEHITAFERCSPNIIAEEVCGVMEPKAKDTHLEEIKVIRDFDPQIGEVLLDPKAIHRGLLNLVSNAIDACLVDENEGKNHVVKVITKREGQGNFVFQVTDNGCGMEDVVKNQVFNSFVSTKGSRGTGLGLLITQKIVQEHEGTLKVDSEIGKGSTFTMQLPVKRGN
ncbi:MAG TPA: CBS domain-containing protein [Deltaproteobacteria bacterium]|nr:CBS domain-containing protein [Deltaproteobacteria bacterium]